MHDGPSDSPGLADPGLADPGLADPGLADPGLADPGLADPGLAELRRRSDAARDDAVQRLELLVNLESPSGDAERLLALHAVLADRLAELGATVSTVPGPAGDHLCASLGGSAVPGRNVVVVGHLDTVWPAGTLQRRPFRVDGAIAHGPGTLDMKGALVALELALRLMREMSLPFAHPVQVVLVCDEEVSSPDGRGPVLAAAAGAAAVLGLEAAHPNGDLKNGRRGVARIRLEVEGRESHAGLAAADGVSAIDELVDQLLQLRHALADVDGVSCNVGHITGGTRANVVAGQARAELGLRFATPAAQESVLSSVAALAPVRAGAEVRHAVLSSRPAWAPDSGSSIVAFVCEQAARLGEQIGARPAGGAGDTNFTGASGVPTVDGLGPNGRGAHSANEHVRIESILRRAELLALLFSTPLPDPLVPAPA
jgi:glutamate carboxypeptidase